MITADFVDKPAIVSLFFYFAVMTNEEAVELLEHFIGEMDRNGYGEILRLIRIRFEESTNEFVDSQTSNHPATAQLIFFLNNTIEIMESISSSSVPQILDRINEHLDENSRIEGIEVETVDGTTVSLQSLPNYSELITNLRSIYRQIIEEL